MMDGELELGLDGGEKRLVKKGEFLVQRARMHSWKDVSTKEKARMLVISLGAEGVVEGGTEFSQS
jgi:quercetin dioxygenase-like cupin family protein